MFVAEIIVPDPTKRRSRRIPSRTLRDPAARGLNRSLCHIAKLSGIGARLRVWEQLPTGQLLWLSLPDLPPRAARVIWSSNYEVGLSFEKPLTPKLVREVMTGLAAPERQAH